MSHIPPPQPPPTPLNYATPPAGRTDLREIAMRQKGIIYCILGYIVLVACSVILPPPAKGFAALATLGVAAVAAVFVFMLSIAIYNTGAGVALGIATLIPCAGLIVLLIINGK